MFWPLRWLRNKFDDLKCQSCDVEEMALTITAINILPSVKPGEEDFLRLLFTSTGDNAVTSKSAHGLDILPTFESRSA